MKEHIINALKGHGFRSAPEEARATLRKVKDKPVPMGGSGGTMSMPLPAMVLQQIPMIDLFEIKAAELAKRTMAATWGVVLMAFGSPRRSEGRV